MICYQITKTDLEALIEDETPGWLQKARERTKTFRAAGRCQERSSIWSQVKPVYMKLQGESKCAYCERKLESIDYGKIELDVEHFRPKRMVQEWQIPQSLKKMGITTTKVPNENSGYYLLPYHPFNYIATCKSCNSALKKNYFPIFGNYDLINENPEDLLRNEKPFLIYPIGDFDEAPENLIRFHGVSPQAVANNGYERNRALVTIEFFKLDDFKKRKNLIRERASIIISLHLLLEKLAESPDDRDTLEIVKGSVSSSAPHTNCARSYKRLFESDRTEATEIFKKAGKLIGSSS